MTSDWRDPQLRREAFQRFYTFHVRWKAHPGLVYSWLPALAKHYDLNQDGQAWLVWLNGNTQNPVTSLLLLEASGGSPERWEDAVGFWNDNFKSLEWDTDRRHQKSVFGRATEQWAQQYGPNAAMEWQTFPDWKSCWQYSLSQPWMGRLSAWSMLEYARIMFGPNVPDMGSLLLGDKTGSQSHRNGLRLMSSFRGTEPWWDVPYYTWDNYTPELVEELELLGEDLLAEAWERNPNYAEDVTRLTLESALCTYKSWHKPNRRYPGVYADMAYLRLKRGEKHFGKRFQVLWDARQRDLPDYLRSEDRDVRGLSTLDPATQNHYRETGQPPYLWRMFPDMKNDWEGSVLL